MTRHVPRFLLAASLLAVYPLARALEAPWAPDSDGDRVGSERFEKAVAGLKETEQALYLYERIEPLRTGNRRAIATPPRQGVSGVSGGHGNCPHRAWARLCSRERGGLPQRARKTAEHSDLGGRERQATARSV